VDSATYLLLDNVAGAMNQLATQERSWVYAGRPYFVANCAGYDEDGERENSNDRMLFATLCGGMVLSEDAVRSLVEDMASCLVPSVTECVPDMQVAICLNKSKLGTRQRDPHSHVEGAMQLDNWLVHFHDITPSQVLVNGKVSMSDYPLSFCGISRRESDDLHSFEKRSGPISLSYSSLASFLRAGNALVE